MVGNVVGNVENVVVAGVAGVVGGVVVAGEIVVVVVVVVAAAAVAFYSLGGVLEQIGQMVGDGKVQFGAHS